MVKQFVCGRCESASQENCIATAASIMEAAVGILQQRPPLLLSVCNGIMNQNRIYTPGNCRKILVVCSYTEKEAAFKAPKGFDMDAARLILQNYPDPGNTMRPYEVRVYLWENKV